MAAPTTPVKPGFSRAFWDLLSDLIIIASNLSIPVSGDASQTGVISGTTASTVLSAVQKQRDLM